MATNSPSTQRNELDPVFKRVLLTLGNQLNFTPQTQVEVSHLPRTIDVVIELSDAADRERLQAATSFNRLRAHNQLEFKGIGDSLTLADYYTIRGRLYFYLSQQRLSLSHMSLSIVCARKPVKLLKNEELNFQAVGEGYYLGGELLPTLLIVINELPLLPQHYPLLLFASSEQTFRQTLRQMLAAERYHDFIQYAYVVRPTITQEEVMMSRSAYLTDKNLNFILNDIGEELMVRLTDTEMVQKSPAYKALIAEWEERLKQWEERLKQSEQRAKQVARQREKEQQALLQEKHRSLLRILKHRFTDLSPEAVQQIELTADADVLEGWLERAFEVGHWQELGLTVGGDER